MLIRTRKGYRGLLKCVKRKIRQRKRAAKWAEDPRAWSTIPAMPDTTTNQYGNTVA